MDPTSRFDELMRCSDDVPLDEALFVIAAHDHDVDIGAQVARLDELAADAPFDPDRLARHLFGDDGFLGNALDYTDPRNSFLDCVLDRRLGIPITLSVLMIEVGRRCEVPLVGVGMPGHFLVGGPDGRYYDPFNGGQRLDAAGAAEVFAGLRPGAPFHHEYLAPVDAPAILARVLTNLVHTFVERAPTSAVWAVRLRLRIPDRPLAERRDAAALLGSLGRFAEAAAALDALVPDLDHASAAKTAREAAALRARAN